MTLGSYGMCGDTAGLGLKLLVFFAPRLGPEDTRVPCPRLWRREWKKLFDLVKIIPGEGRTLVPAALWCPLPWAGPLGPGRVWPLPA